MYFKIIIYNCESESIKARVSQFKKKTIVPLENALSD